MQDGVGMERKPSPNVHTLVLMAVLVAAEIVLSRFLSFSVWNMKVGFAFLPVVIAAITLGPWKAGVIGGVADLVGALLFPIGAYFPGFTLTAFLMGAVFGLFLYREVTLPRILAAVGINQLALSLLLNTLWISVLYGSPYGALFVTRLTQCAILIPVQVVTIGVLTKTLGGYLHKLSAQLG